MTGRARESAPIDAIRSAAERLALRLRFRETTKADLDACSPAVPRWWREGLAGAAIFGDGHLSLPSRAPDRLSRPVSFLTATEISVTAGGEYVPVAWVDGGELTALVRDRGELPVYIIEPGSCGVAIPAADSLVEFLETLVPQSLCQLVDGDSTASIELRSERSVLVERDGVLEHHELSDPGEMGEFVATFIRRALEAGMRPRFCPANLRPIIESYLDLIVVEVPTEQHAQAVIQHLLRNRELVLEANVDLEELVDGAARFLDGSLQQGVTVALARRFADWLLQQPAVDDVYADDDALVRALKFPALLKCS